MSSESDMPPRNPTAGERANVYSIISVYHMSVSTVHPELDFEEKKRRIEACHSDEQSHCEAKTGTINSLEYPKTVGIYYGKVQYTVGEGGFQIYWPVPHLGSVLSILILLL